jgi:hypothetical protein
VIFSFLGVGTLTGRSIMIVVIVYVAFGFVAELEAVMFNMDPAGSVV